MMEKIRPNPVTLWIAVGVGLIVAISLIVRPVYRLEVSCEGRPEALLSLPVSAGDRFSVRFLHSYDRAFFQENYSISSDSKILLRNMTFKSHLNGGGFAYSNFHLRPDGVGELREIDEVHEKIRFMMGSKDLADHQLIFKEKTFHLSDGVEPFEIVEIKLKKRMVLWGVLEKITLSL
jgi:hypothetical protein